jgi:hypothetical protein
MNFAIPHGATAYDGHKTTAFWGKQKNFNIFSFPEVLDADTSLFGLARGQKASRRPVN